MSIPPDALALRLRTVRIIWIAMSVTAVFYTSFGAALARYVLTKPLLSESAAE